MVNARDSASGVYEIDTHSSGGPVFPGLCVGDYVDIDSSGILCITDTVRRDCAFCGGNTNYLVRVVSREELPISRLKVFGPLSGMQIRPLRSS